MTSMRMIDVGLPYKKIVSKRKWIGRVYRHSAGHYVGVIKGVGEVKAATEREAFEEIGARAMGYSSASELRANNLAVRRRRKHMRQEAQWIAHEYRNGNPKPLFDAFDKAFGIGKKEQ